MGRNVKVYHYVDVGDVQASASYICGKQNGPRFGLKLVQ